MDQPASKVLFKSMLNSRKRSGTKPQESQERFRRLLDDSPMAISIINREGTIEYVNKTHQEIMGYDLTDIPTLERWWSLAYPDAEERKLISLAWNDIVERLFRGERINNVMRRITCKDGTVKDLELRITRLWDTIIVTFDDITERAKMESLLRRAKEDWEETFNIINDAITVQDSDFNIIRANKAAEGLLGLPFSKMLSRKCYECFHGTYSPLRDCPICVSLKDGTPSVTEIFEPHLDKYLEIKALPRFDKTGSLSGIIHIVRDITQRKKTEMELAEQQGLVSNLIDNSAVATFVLDRSHKIMIWNKACEELTGSKASDMIGTDNQWRPFYPFQRPTVADVIIAGDHANLPHLYMTYSTSTLNPLAIRAEGWYKNLGGRDRYIVFEASPIYDGNGELIAAIETLQDLTESKRLEAQLLQSQKIEAIGQLAGGVAHDFNNILTAIVGYAHLALVRLSSDDPLRINMEQILQASDRATALTRGLLAFSRKQIMNPGRVSLNEIVIRIQKLLARLIREDIHIETHCSEDELTVFADSGQIEQVIMNLVTNARDSMPEGGLIVIRTSMFSMDKDFVDTHGFGKVGPYARLLISDTGVGMDEKTKQKIFEPFFTTKEQGKGTGLGLSMVYGIVKQHDGFINVYSSPGKGTSFQIYLPLVAGGARVEPSQELTIVAKSGSETILLAEDDSSLRELMSFILRSHGYTVVEALDGDDAAAKYAANSEGFQLLILDVIMPKINGKEVLQKIRLINPSAKAIFISGYAEDIISRQRVIESGTNFIQKPFSPSEFLKKVREVLDAEGVK